MQSSGTWTGVRGTAAPSSSRPAGSLSGSLRHQGPPVWAGRSPPCPPAPPSYKNFPTAGRQHGVRPAITPGAKRAGCLGSSSPVVERHPTGPNTAAQPGKGRRARCVSWTFPLALEDNYPGPKTHNRPPVHGLVYGDCDVGVAPWRVGHRTGWSQRCCPAERAPRSVCCLRIPPHRLVKKQTPCTFIDQPLFQNTRQLFQ